jgi:hypothetical protein
MVLRRRLVPRLTIALVVPLRANHTVRTACVEDFGVLAD